MSFVKCFFVSLFANMNRSRLLILVLTFLTLLPSMAQKRKVPQLTPEQQEHLAKLERMTANTQRIMFIDSIVINKQQFLNAYKLSSEVGRILRYQDFKQDMQQPNAYAYINELGTRCYISQETADSTINLYLCETSDNGWSNPIELKGINDEGEFQRVNYPFMMGDGQTFYFAAVGDEGLGGYDIYVTRYDADDDQFLRPANIGMPFNSEANDYLYVIDEYTNLGWFATDRNQPVDSVCVYTFIPRQSRQTYSALGFSSKEILPFARIDRIADTWDDKEQFQAARQRLLEVTQRKTDKTIVSDFLFVINDDVVYTRLSDFKANGNQQRFQQLTTMRKNYEHLVTTLERTRNHYSTATQKERNELCHELLAHEQQQQKLFVDIHNLEKTIRNNENIFLTNNK